MYCLLEIIGAALCVGVVVYYLTVERTKHKENEA